MRSLILFAVICMIAAIITAQSEPGQPPSPPVYNTQGAVIDPAPLPPPLAGSTLPATVTPWPTPRVTPTFFLPTTTPDSLDSINFAWRTAGKVLRFVVLYIEQAF